MACAVLVQFSSGWVSQANRLVSRSMALDGLHASAHLLDLVGYCCGRSSWSAVGSYCCAGSKASEGAALGSNSTPAFSNCARTCACTGAQGSLNRRPPPVPAAHRHVARAGRAGSSTCCRYGAVSSASAACWGWGGAWRGARRAWVKVWACRRVFPRLHARLQPALFFLFSTGGTNGAATRVIGALCARRGSLGRTVKLLTSNTSKQ